MTGAQTRGVAPSWTELSSLLAAWAGFGLFTIVCGTVIALHADRLAHRRRQMVLTGYFEHVLQLPLSYHGNTHSGRLMKVMLQGTDSLWGMWLGFFRDHLASFISLLVLLPVSLIINWRLALLLIALCFVFAALTALIVRKTETLQSSVEQHYSDLAERASDTLGNIALVQSFSRLDVEVLELRQIVERLLAAQIPVLSWWALASVLTRLSTTLTVLSIIVAGTWLHIQGKASIGEMVTFMNFAGLIIIRLEQSVAFVNKMMLEAPRLREFFQVWDTIPAIRDLSDAIDPGKLKGLVEFKHVSFSYDGERMAAADLNFTAQPGDTIALVGATGAGKSTAIALLHRAFDPQSGSIEIDGTDIRHFRLAALRHNIGVVFQEALLFNRSIADNLRVEGGRHRGRDGGRRTPRPGARLHPAEIRGLQRSRRRARPRIVGRRAPAAVDRARPAEEPTDPDPRRSHQRTRRRHRSQGDAGTRRSDEKPHDLRDRAPAFDRAQGHTHSGVRCGTNRGDRDLRRTGPGRRALRGAGRHATDRAGARRVGKRNQFASINWLC